MNSLSKTHCKDDCEPSKKCCHKKDEQEFVLLKVGNPQNTIIPSTSVNGNTFIVASLPVKIGCLDDPEIKIDFTANIITGGIVTLSSGATISFQVNKVFISPFSPLNSVTVGPVWNFAPTTVLGGADIISFFVEDEDEFDNGLVKYTVTATVLGLSTLTTLLGGPISVNNATLAATIAAEEEEA
jgi:hypothetical protein